MNMTIACARHTRHVLAVVTRAVAPKSEKAPADEAARTALDKQAVETLLGDALVVRHVKKEPAGVNVDEFFIQADDLTAVTLEPRPDVLQEPRSWYCDADGKIQPASTAMPTIAYATSGRLTVILPDTVQADTAVWVQARGTSGTDPTPQTRSGIVKFITGTEKDVKFHLPVSAEGNYVVLVLAAGYRPVVRKFAVA